MLDKRPFTILALASDFKGVPYLQEAKRQGCRVLLLVAKEFTQYDWPWDSIDEHFVMPSLSKLPDITYAASYLMRS